MALTPTDNDAFLREVDENLRRDQFTGFFTRWGKLVIAGIVAFLVALGVFLWWQDHRAKQAGAEGEQLAQALTFLEQGQAAKATAPLATLAQSSRDGYRAAAGLTQAAVAAASNDMKGAAARYEAIAADQAMPQATRDLALIRAITLNFDAVPPATVVARLKPLAVPGSAWFGSAGELVAAADLKMNRPDLAGPLLAQIARDPNAPLSLRGRVAGLAAALGQTVAPINAAASAPKE